MRTCNQCYTEKPLTEFYQHESTKDGYMLACKTCMADRRRLAKAGGPCIKCGALPRYTARLVCKRCVADEQIARKRQAQGGPLKRGRRNQTDGNVERIRRIEAQPLDGYNEVMGRMAKVSLRVSA